MIFGEERLDELTEKIRGFLKENHLAADYFKRLQGNLPAGTGLPDMKTVIDNANLRYDLICYLSYRISLMKEEYQIECGQMLIEELDMMEFSLEKGMNKMEQSACEIAGLLKELDYFKYAEYMKAGDSEADPVRRIYADLMIPQKRQALSGFLLDFSGTEHRERIRNAVNSLQEAVKQEARGCDSRCR